MAEFDRFDICDAYAVMEWDYNCNGWLQERPSNKRRMESTSSQLHRMKFNPSIDLSYANMSENAQEIYRAAEFRYGFRPQRIQGECRDLTNSLDALIIFSDEEMVDFERMAPKALLAAAGLIWKTLDRTLCSPPAVEIDIAACFEPLCSDLASAIHNLSDTLNWLFDEPTPAPLPSGTPMPLIRAEYSEHGYIVLADDVVTYQTPADYFKFSKLAPGMPGFSLERMRITAEKSALDECRKQRGCFVGAKFVTKLP